jgi:hypothetical protein
VGKACSEPIVFSIDPLLRRKKSPRLHNDFPSLLMTDINVRTQEPASDCNVCGNPLASPDATCPRCKTKPAAVIAAESSSSEATPNKVFPDRFDGKKTSMNPRYPSVAKPETSTFIAQRQSSRRIKFTAAALIAMAALIAGASYLYYGSGNDTAPGNGTLRDAKSVTGPLAENDPAETAQRASIDAPLAVKNASTDVTGIINAVRSAMVRGELNTARKQLAMLPPGVDQRADVQRITFELVQREHARDSALGLARACEKAGDVPCVLRSAGDALASDVSDSDARAMLLRAVTQSGANQVIAVKVNQRSDSANLTHRQPLEKRRIRRGQQVFANNNEIYGKH